MRKLVAIVLMLMLLVTAFGATAEATPTVTLSFDSAASSAGLEAVIAKAEADIGVKVEIEIRPGGVEGNNLVKARLASGDMNDIIFFNSGCLLKELNPNENFLDLNAYPQIVDKLEDSFKSAVSVNGGVFGVPFSSSQEGCVLYNKAAYEKLGLAVPQTWQQFLDNCAACKEAGYDAVIATYGDSWTSQMLFLSDYYNVVAENPTFAQDFEAGIVKYAGTPTAIQSFQKYIDIKDYCNADYVVATYNDGVDYLAEGTGVHWIMSTLALENIYNLYGKEVGDGIGAFAVPNNDGTSGVTVWPSNALYVNKNTANLDAVIAFIEYYISDVALDTYASVLKPCGPFAVKGYEMGDDVYKAVSEDLQVYFNEGKAHVAQEFECGVKGANCESVCIEAATGAITAEEAAQIYDDDCYKMAVQLGLNWD